VETETATQTSLTRAGTSRRLNFKTTTTILQSRWSNHRTSPLRSSISTNKSSLDRQPLPQLSPSISDAPLPRLKRMEVTTNSTPPSKIGKGSCSEFETTRFDGKSLTAKKERLSTKARVTLGSRKKLSSCGLVQWKSRPNLRPRIKRASQMSSKIAMWHG